MEQRRQEYEGHRIELRGREGTAELLIDDAPVTYGRLPNGEYYLHGYAYDPADDLMEFARRFIAYRLRSERVRRERGSGEGRG